MVKYVGFAPALLPTKFSDDHSLPIRCRMFLQMLTTLPLSLNIPFPNMHTDFELSISLTKSWLQQGHLSVFLGRFLTVPM